VISKQEEDDLERAQLRFEEWEESLVDGTANVPEETEIGGAGGDLELFVAISKLQMEVRHDLKGCSLHGI
jgi:hypothetical protein